MVYEKQKKLLALMFEEVLGIGTTHAINMLKDMFDKDLSNIYYIFEKDKIYCIIESIKVYQRNSANSLSGRSD